MKTTFYFLFVFILVLNCFSALTQEIERPFVVSPLIGDTLSLDERDNYNLFPTINNFLWAVFYLNNDSTLNVKVTYINRSVIKDTLIENYRTLNSFLIYMNYAENPAFVNPVENKDYSGNEVSALFNDGTDVKGKLLSASSSSLIIYASSCDQEKINVNCATLVRLFDLEKLTVKSDFNLGRILYPLVMGLAAVMIFDNAYATKGGSFQNIGDNMKKNFFIGLAVGLGGALAGIGLSYAVPLNIASEKEYSVPLNEDEIERLSKIARYKDFESYYNLFKR